MALTSCHECGYSVSTEAKACPQCGAAPKKSFSRLKIAVIGFAVVAVGLMASRPDSETSVPAADPVYPRTEISPQARALIRAGAKDEDSLKFRHEFTARAGVYCGEVNGKNSLGAYAGFKRFIANHKTVLFDDETTQDFSKAWREFCAPQSAAPQSAAG